MKSLSWPRNKSLPNPVQLKPNAPSASLQKVERRLAHLVAGLFRGVFFTRNVKLMLSRNAYAESTETGQ